MNQSFGRTHACISGFSKVKQRRIEKAILQGTSHQVINQLLCPYQLWEYKLNTNNLAFRLTQKQQKSGYESTREQLIVYQFCMQLPLCYLLVEYTLGTYTKVIYKDICLLILLEASYNPAPHKYSCRIQMYPYTTEFNATIPEGSKFTSKKASMTYSCIQVGCITLCLS